MSKIDQSLNKIGELFVKKDFHPNFDTFFRDRPYIFQSLYNFISTLAGRVEGELTLNIPRDLRSLYAAPFSAETAAKDPDSVKKLNDCCYEWIQSVEKVLKDITKDPKAEKKKENKKDELLKSAKEEELKTKPFVVGKTDNEVLKEIEANAKRAGCVRGCLICLSHIKVIKIKI